jgi:hypothetical protein
MGGGEGDERSEPLKGLRCGKIGESLNMFPIMIYPTAALTCFVPFVFTLT